MRDLKFSVIGFGRIGQRHAKIINEFKGTNLISVSDVDPAAFESMTSLDLAVIAYQSIDEFLEKDNGKSDVVNIATPNGLHTDNAIHCLS